MHLVAVVLEQDRANLAGAHLDRVPLVLGQVRVESAGGRVADINSNWQRFSGFFTTGAGKERGHKSLPMLQAAPGPLDTHRPRDAYGEMRKKLAIKCDLCAGYDNQACVQACPTGAAIRVQPTTFFGSTEDILSQRAL